MHDITSVVFVYSFGIEQQLMKIINILLNNVCDIFELSQLMAIVLGKHALRANNWMANFAEVFYFLILVLIAKYFPRVSDVSYLLLRIVDFIRLVVASIFFSSVISLVSRICWWCVTIALFSVASSLLVKLLLLCAVLRTSFSLF